MRTDCCSAWRSARHDHGDSSEDVFTYSIAPKFKLNDRMAIYARVAKGFRPGGPNVIAPDAPPGTPTSYGSDSTLNYELGFKGENEARTCRLRRGCLPYRLGRHPVAGRVNGIGINTNAGSAKSDGVEASLMFRPVDRLKLSLTGAYTDAKLTEDADPILVGGRDGDHLPYTPKTSYSASADYDWPLADGRSAYVGASFSHLSEVPAAFDAAFVAAEWSPALPARRTTWSTCGPAGTSARYPWSCSDGISPTMKARLRTRSGNTPNGAIATGVIRPRSYGLTVTAEF